MSPRLFRIASLTIASLVLISCGGGGGGSSSTNSSTPPVSTPAAASTYISGVAVGDFGSLTVSADKSSFTFTFVDSGYGLTNKTVKGTLALDTNGAYIGTTEGKNFPLLLTDSYAVASVQMDPVNSPNDWTPVFGVLQDKAISSAKTLLSYGNAFKNTGYDCNVSNNVPTACWATSVIGILTPVAGDDTKINVIICDNGSQQEDNYNLSYCYSRRNTPSSISIGTNPNAPHPGNITQITASYNPATKTWDTTPNDKSKISRGVFVYDSSTNSVVGFFDSVGKVAGSSNGFSFLTMDFSNVASPTGNYYTNIIPKQSTVSGGNGGHGFQQQLTKADGSVYDQCANGVPAIANNMNEWDNQVDLLTPTSQAIPGYIYLNDKAAPHDNYVLGFAINNGKGAGIGVFARNTKSTSNNNAPVDDFKLVYFSPQAGHCY